LLRDFVLELIEKRFRGPQLPDIGTLSEGGVQRMKQICRSLMIAAIAPKQSEVGRSSQLPHPGLLPLGGSHGAVVATLGVVPTLHGSKQLTLGPINFSVVK
jgi:hypothetical protein